MKQTFPYRYRVLIFLFFLTFITYLDRVSIALVDKWIKSEFHLNNTQWGVIGGAFALSYALFEIPSGVWGDRIGQRATFIRIVLWWSLFTALTGVTTGFVSLLLVRFLFGIGEAGAFPNTAAVISKWFPAQESSRGISVAWSGLFAGMAVAPFVVMTVTHAYGWRATFFVNGALGVVWVAVCVLWFKNNPSDVQRISAEERTLIESNRRYFDHKQKYPWKRILKNQSLLALVTAFSISQSLNYFFIFWMPSYLREGRHISENEIKWIYTLAYSVATICCFFGGYFSDWTIKRKGIKFGRRSFGFSTLAGPGLSILAQALTSNHTMIMVTLIIGISFYSLVAIPFFGTCVDIGGNRAATISGTMNFCGQSAAFLFSIIFGRMADKTGFSLPVYILIAALIAGAFLWYFVDPSKQLITKDQTPSTLAEFALT
jgi:MFS transporter, ACS family, glucarate transporter